MTSQQQTQSQKKLTQRLEDLRRNEVFIKKIEEIKRLLEFKSNFSNETEETLEGIEGEMIMHYELYKQAQEKRAKLLNPELNRLYNELAREYKIDFALINLILKQTSLAEEITLDRSNDFFKVEDAYKKIEDIKLYTDSPIEFDEEYLSDSLSYPVHIKVHRFSSKRDLINFIESRWDIIENILKKYRGEKPLRFRQRRHSIEFLDFIWENQSLDSKKLEKLVKDKFPNKNLTYFELRGLINQEKKRRLKKFTVGQ